MGKVYRMTIEYKDSKRISALSTDAWVSSGTKVTSSSGTVTATIDASSLDQYATYDLGSTLSSTWVLRYKQQATTNDLVLTSGNAGALYVGLSDITNISTDANGSGASTLYQRLRHESGNWYVDGFDIRSRDGSATTAGGNSGAGVLSTGAQTYYVEIVKNGSSSTVKYFSNSDYSTGQVGSTQTVDATGSGSSLRYLNVHVLSESRTSGSLVVECSDFKIYDGVTSASGTPTFSNLPDGKPTNVQDNSILVEKDTGRRYWRTPEVSGADTTTTNSNVNDVAHFEGANSANTVIGEQITSGNALIGQAITSLSFWLYKLNSGSSGTETFTFGVWNSSGANVHEFGTVTRGELPQGTAFGNAVKFTKSTGSYVLQTDDILGIRTNSAPASAWTVEVTQRDSDVYSDGQRAIFVQDATPATSAKDIGFEVVSNTVTPATWTWSNDSTRGLFAGANSASDNTIDYITIATLSNASDFGDLTQGRTALTGLESDTRGVFGGGYNGSNVATMDYVTIATTGDATSFGSLITARRHFGSVSNNTRGIFGGGYVAGNVSGMEHITIAVPSGGAVQGNDVTARRWAGGVSSETRGVFGGGYSSSNVLSMDYVTISSIGSTTFFGNLTVARGTYDGLSNGTRGMFLGGYGSTVNVIDYITIATTGTATDFGDLTVGRQQAMGVANLTRGIVAGGSDGSGSYTSIDYITISTPSNTTNFGDLIISKEEGGAVQG